MYTSPDTKTTWISNALPANINFWQAIACSDDGNKLVVVVNGGGIYQSTNSGANWFLNGAAPSRTWWTVVSSPDGSKLAAASTGAVFTSSDSGATWISNNVPAMFWAAVAMSTNGSRMVAVSPLGQIYISQAAPPSLNITRESTNVRLSWPTSAGNFALQQEPTVTDTNWTDVTNVVNVVNEQNQVLVPLSTPKMVFRLKGL